MIYNQYLGTVNPKATLMTLNSIFLSLFMQEWAKTILDINGDLLRIRNWCFGNYLLLNQDKTKLNYGICSPNSLMSVFQMGKELLPRYWKVVKDLGVTFDTNLTFSNHILKTAWSCLSSLAQISRVKHVFITGKFEPFTDFTKCL